jgi:hypothetical protein
VFSGANSGQQTALEKSDHRDMLSREQYNAPVGPQAPLVPPIATYSAKRIFPSAVRDREEVRQYLLRIDDGNGLLMKGGILNMYPALVGRGVS